jgi:hypothetical protein
VKPANIEVADHKAAFAAPPIHDSNLDRRGGRFIERQVLRSHRRTFRVSKCALLLLLGRSRSNSLPDTKGLGPEIPSDPITCVMLPGRSFPRVHPRRADW